jgi:5'-3' exonuclease
MLKKSRCTLIVDGNWLLMSRLSVLNNKYKDELELCQELKVLMLKSVGIVLRQFPIVDNVIFVSDGGSWRNDLKVPQFLQAEGITYQGNREKSDDIDWDLVFGEYDNFLSLLNSTGLTVSKEKGLEGDDWCYYWSTKLNSENTNCIIWSKDKDLTQLVKTNSDNCFTGWWNKESGLILQEVNEYDMDYLFNNNFNDNETVYKEVIKLAKQVTYIDPKTVIIDKIIRGDMGDNIIPIIYKQSKTNPNKKFRVLSKDLDFSIDIHNEDSIKNYIHNLLESKSYAGKVEKSEPDILEHFKYNVKLVELAKDNYPDEIQNLMESHDEYYISKDISVAQNQLTAKVNKIQNILDII